MSSYDILTEDNLLEITDHLDDLALLSYCQTNKAITNLCEHKLWLRRIFNRGLGPLLQYAVSYPSLKEFYFNIRHDAIYVVSSHTQVYFNIFDNIKAYFTDVHSLANYLNNVPIEGTNNSQKVYSKIFVWISNTKHNIHTPHLIPFNDIMDYPNLEPRTLVIVRSIHSAQSVNLTDRSRPMIQFVNFDANNLRKLYKEGENTVDYHSFILYAVNNAIWGPYKIQRWPYGFYFISGGHGALYMLLDYSLFDPSDNNYYFVVNNLNMPVGLYNGLRFARYIDDIDDSSELLAYVLSKGTKYKLEDTLALL